MSKLPIVYVRGFAGPTSGIDAQVDDPFYGFNDGSTHVRVGGDGNPRYWQFESPMLRLMIDEQYQLLVKGDQLAYLTQSAKGAVPPASLWVHRFYDTAASTFGTPPHHNFFSRLWHNVEDHLAAPGFHIEDAARSLYDLVELVLDRTGAPKVILVAHSMGGLIARSMLQKISQTPAADGTARRAGNDIVAKLFTIGTPHGGIEFEAGVLNWAMETFGPAGADIFAPAKMIGYLHPEHSWGDIAPSDWDPRVIPDGIFDPDDIFCIVGTDPKDYGPSKNVVGVKSDGLVKIENAYVKGAHRAFIHRSHSGRYGEVNSEETYQSLRRFCFGAYQVSIELINLELADTARQAWQADVQVAIRGLPVLITEQTAGHYCPVQLNLEQSRHPSDSPDSPVPIVGTFLLTPNRAVTYAGQQPVSDRSRYTLTVRVSHLVSSNGFFDWKNHLEQVADFADTLIVDVGTSEGPDGSKLTAWVAWNSLIPGAPDSYEPVTAPLPGIQRSATLDGDSGSFEVPLPPTAAILGARAALKVTVRSRAD